MFEQTTRYSGYFVIVRVSIVATVELKYNRGTLQFIFGLIVNTALWHNGAKSLVIRQYGMNSCIRRYGETQLKGYILKCLDNFYGIFIMDIGNYGNDIVPSCRIAFIVSII